MRGNSVRSGATGDIQQRVCIFCFRMESLTTESNVAREKQLNIGLVFCVFGGGIFSRLSFGRGNTVIIGAGGVIEQRVCIFDLRLQPRQDGQKWRACRN